MPIPPYRPAPLRWQMFRGSQALAEGLLTPNQLRSFAWRRQLRDVYVDSRLETDHGLACQAASLLMPDDAAICGASAAYLWGVETAANPSDNVHVAVPPDTSFGPVNGIVIHATDPGAGDLRNGIRCTTPSRTAWDIARWAPPARSVPILDAMCARRLVDETSLRALTVEFRGRRGWRQAASAFDLVDGRAQSPPESVLRVRLIMAGLPRPVPQYEIRTRRGIVLHPDLAIPQYQIAIEYDGRYHDDPERLDLDRRRINLLVAEGWIVLHATAATMRRDLARFIAEVETSLRARGWRP